MHPSAPLLLSNDSGDFCFSFPDWKPEAACKESGVAEVGLLDSSLKKKKKNNFNQNAFIKL